MNGDETNGNGNKMKSVAKHGATAGIALTSGLAMGLLITGGYKQKVDAHEIAIPELQKSNSQLERIIAVCEQRLTTSEERLKTLEYFVYERTSKK
jgi:hypothetical protein